MLVLGTAQEPATLDPAFATRASEQTIARLLFPDLLEFDPSGRVVPRLAKSLPEVETSTAGRTVRWTVRDGLAWSDGRPVTGADVAFAVGIEADPDVDAVNHELAAQVGSVELVDERRFTVHWRTQARGVAAPRTHTVLPAHAYPSERGPDFSGLGREPRVSAGPFRLLDWQPGQRLTLEPNPHWPGPEPGLDRIVFRFFPGEEAFESELRAGGIDGLSPCAGLGPDHARRLGERLAETHRVVRQPSGLWLHLLVRVDHPELRRPELRRGIHLALDRPRMAELVYGGWARPAYGLYSALHPAHRHRPTTPDPAEARRLIGEAGPITLGFAAGSEASERAATYLGAALADVGLELDLAPMPFRVLMAKMATGDHPPLTVFAWRTRPDWSPASLFRAGGRQNHSGYRNQRVEAKLDEAERTVDELAWVSLLREVEDQVLEDLPVIPLLFRDEVSVVPLDLEGWRPTGTTTPVTWNAEAWRRGSRWTAEGATP